MFFFLFTQCSFLELIENAYIVCMMYNIVKFSLTKIFVEESSLEYLCIDIGLSVQNRYIIYIEKLYFHSCSKFHYIGHHIGNQ